MNDLVSIVARGSWYSIAFIVKDENGGPFLATRKIQGLKKLTQYVFHNKIIHVVGQPVAFTNSYAIEKLINRISVKRDLVVKE